MIRKHIFLPSLRNHPFFCFPECVGWYAGDEKHNVRREENELNSFNLHVVINGKGYLEEKGVVHTLQQGDAFLYFPGEAETYRSDTETPWEVLWLHFNGKRLKDFLLEQGFHPTVLWTLKTWRNVSSAIHLLLEEAEKNTILHMSSLSTLTYGILSEFMAEAVPHTPNKGFDLIHRIIDSLDRLRESSTRPFSLKHWADELEVSTFYYCKTFKKAVGISPTAFVTLCRLQKAKQLLLEEPGRTVKQVAVEAGYPSISYFGRLFLENEGVTPAEYRKRHNVSE